MAKKKKSSTTNKKNKKIKGPKTTDRTLEERTHEIEVLREKLESLELGPERIPEIDDFFKNQVQQYLDLGIPACGYFPLVGCKRVLHYRLSLKKMHEVAIELKFNDDV